MSTTKTKPTEAQIHCLEWAVASRFLSVYPGYDVRADVIKRCQEKGWLHRWQNCLTAQGFLTWLATGERTEDQVAKLITKYEELAYQAERERVQQAERAERWKPKPPTGMTMTFTFNEWFAILNSLEQATIHYRADMHGVDLMTLHATIKDKYTAIAEKIQQMKETQ